MEKKIIKITDYICEYSIYLLFFCLPFSKAGMQFFCWLAILGWIIKKTTIYPGIFLKRKITNAPAAQRYIPSTSLNKYFLLFILACVVSAAFSIDSSLSFKALIKKVLKYIALYLIVVETINTKRRFKNVIISLVSIASLLAVDTIVQYFRGMDFLRGFAKESEGLRACFETRNGFGGWLIMAIPIILGLTIERKDAVFKRRAVKFYLVLLFTCLALILILTHSRSAWLGLGFALSFIVAYLLRKTTKKNRVFTAIALVCMGIAFALLTPQPVKSRLASIPRIENSNLFRINLWKESLQIIEDFPLFGVGLNTYAQAGPHYSMGDGGYYPHNSYLHMAAEIGLLGLASFLLLIAKVFHLGLTTLKKTNDLLLTGIIASIIALLIQSFFDVNLYALQLATLFWFSISLFVARVNLITNQ